MATRKPYNNHIPFDNFVAFNAGDEMGEFMLTDDMRHKMNLAWRVWTLAIIRMNNWGHAGFKPGELATMACGEDTKTTRAMVRKAVKNLGEMGWIKPMGTDMGSTVHCIVVNPLWAYRGAGKASDFLCAEPTHLGRQKELWDTIGIKTGNDPLEPTATEPEPAQISAPQTRKPAEDDPWREQQAPRKHDWRTMFDG